LEIIKRRVNNIAKLKHFLYKTITGPVGSRRLRLPDFKKIGHMWFVSKVSVLIFYSNVYWTHLKLQVISFKV
jgi:hypothetical protein